MFHGLNSVVPVCHDHYDSVYVYNQANVSLSFFFFFFFQAEDGIRDVLGSRGLGDVYKRQDY